MADALDSGSSARKGVEVQVLSRADLEKVRSIDRTFLFLDAVHLCVALTPERRYNVRGHSSKYRPKNFGRNRGELFCARRYLAEWA